jgi:hypothetical protein
VGILVAMAMSATKPSLSPFFLFFVPDGKRFCTTKGQLYQKEMFSPGNGAIMSKEPGY